MKKEIKVHKYYDENDDYVELWKVIGEEKYYGRYTYNNEGTWYYVADPLGYCELDRPVSNDVMFILCDEEGTEYHRYSNEQPNPLPKFADYIKMQWKKVKDNIPHNTENDEVNLWTMWISGETVRKLEQWIISFKDPDLYGDKAKDYDVNWYGCWHNTETEYTPIPSSEFEYLGNKYQFVKVHHKHDVCGVEWDTFECCDNPIQMSPFGTETHPFVESYGEMGNWFDDSKYGTMMDSMTARNKVAEKLTELFPKEKDYQKLLVVKVKKNPATYEAPSYCWEMTYGNCAEMLIDRDYHVKNISDLIENIKDKTENLIFVANHENRKKVMEMYPDIYGYDMCLY